MDGEQRTRSSRRVWWLAALLLLVYVSWMLAPYVSSVFIRDAAVTAWVNVATSPIQGTVDEKLPLVGQPVRADGTILEITNELADRSGLEEAAAEVSRAETTVAELKARVQYLQQLDSERQAQTERYASGVNRMLAIEVDAARQQLEFTNQRLALTHALADRKSALAKRGTGAQSDVDEAMAEVAALEHARVEQERLIAKAELRQSLAAAGTFLDNDGADPEWGMRSRDAFRLELARTHGELTQAEATLAKAQVALRAEQELFGQVSHERVAAPAGTLIWSVMVGAGAAVETGTPVAMWIDCSRLLVDVPASDVEVGLLEPGMPAEVVLEGETDARPARILLTRGSAATLGPTDLAALAKGREPGTGQVLLDLGASPAGQASCPVGDAAYVHFPDIGLMRILRARLRL